jgi:4'-phosphopantetheinyl transferase
MARLSIAADEIYLWLADLSVPEHEYKRLLAVTSADEQYRARRLRLESRRRRFVAGRGTLRVLLARYLGTTPERVGFRYGIYGKPALDTRHASDIEFSVAHSDDLAVFAIGRGADLGVDVEHMHTTGAGAIVEQFFTAGERAVYARLPEADKPLAFLHAWTRKEAYLKGCGAGLSGPFTDVEVTMTRGEPTRLLSTGATGRAGDWWLADLPSPGTYIGAVAARGGPRRLTMDHVS